MAPYIMPVNPFENHKDAKSSIAGFKNALSHLRDGHPLGIFPAGEVSTYKDGKLIVDRALGGICIKTYSKSRSACSSYLFSCKE